jgi:hypothetical protein
MRLPPIFYARISPGTGFADGVFENKTTLDKFFGSRIIWNQHGGWTVSLRDGTEYTVQGCGAKSKPGQRAVKEIKNAGGDRLSIQRDHDGNIVRITSPTGTSSISKMTPTGESRRLRTTRVIGSIISMTSAAL